MPVTVTEAGPRALAQRFPFTVFYQGKYQNIPSFGIIEMVKKNLDLIQEKMALKSLLYLLIETLQNIERYSTHTVSSEDCALIYMDQGNFYVYTRNLVDVDKVAKLKERLAFLDGKSREELDKEYISVLSTGEKTEKGAGLGLIDLARKTHNRLIYELHEFDTKSSVYAICFAMPVRRDDISVIPDFDDARAIMNMMKEHYGRNQSTLFYSGDFSNKFVHALLNFLKNSKEESEGSGDSTLHYILIELTQNIRRHSKQVNGASQGQITIEWNGNNISISTVNPVQEPNGTKLKEKIEKINRCTLEELKSYNQAILTDFSTDSGVGLIDVGLLIKGNKIECDIIKTPNFTDQVSIKLDYKNE